MHSSLAKLRYANYMSIHAELNANNWEEAYASVLEVFDGLKNEAVPMEELSMLRRYIKGNLLQSLDGAFAFASYLMNSILYDLDMDRVNSYIQFLDRVDPDEIMATANKYLHEDRFCKIVAGV